METIKSSSNGKQLKSISIEHAAISLFTPLAEIRINYHQPPQGGGFLWIFLELFPCKKIKMWVISNIGSKTVSKNK